MNTESCARARLLMSDLMQILRDSRHSLHAHHNPAACLLDAAIECLEPLNARLQRDCTAERVPPWEAPQLAQLCHFMDNLGIDVDGERLRAALTELIEAVADWLTSQGLDTLAGPVRQVAARLPEPPPAAPLDELEPVNEEGS